MVKVRKFRTGGWEVHITFRLPDGSIYRERKKAPVTSKSGAQRWDEDRERHLLHHGLPKPKREVLTFQEFAPLFLDGHARAKQQKPSGIAAKETIVSVHLVPLLGTRKLDAITTEDVKDVKMRLRQKKPKTVNNVLMVLNTMLRKAIEWGVLEQMPCHVRLLPAPKPAAHFHDFAAYESLIEAAKQTDWRGELIVLLGGEAGLRCGEMMALEWSDVDTRDRRLCVARSEWKGQVTTPKGNRLRACR